MTRPRGRTRPFTPVDAAILALGLALGAWAAVRLDPLFLQTTWAYASVGPPWRRMPTYLAELELPLKRAQADLIAALVPISLAVALATFRRRVGGFRRLASSPGLAASAALAGSILVDIGLDAPDLDWSLTTAAFSVYWTNLMEFFKLDATAPLGAIWTCQAAAGSWRPRDDWRDWLGRWLGATWLALIGLDAAFVMVWG